jgi:hypothetical protein
VHCGEPGTAQVTRRQVPVVGQLPQPAGLLEVVVDVAEVGESVMGLGAGLDGQRGLQESRGSFEVAGTHRLLTGDDEAVSRGRPHEPMIGPPGTEILSSAGRPVGSGLRALLHETLHGIGRENGNLGYATQEAVLHRFHPQRRVCADSTHLHSHKGAEGRSRSASGRALAGPISLTTAPPGAAVWFARSDSPIGLKLRSNPRRGQDVLYGHSRL